MKLKLHSIAVRSNDDHCIPIPTSRQQFRSGVTYLAIAFVAIASLVLTLSTALTKPAAAASSPAVTSIASFGENAESLPKSEAVQLANSADLPTESLSGLKVDRSGVQAWSMSDGTSYVSYPLVGDGVQLATVGALLDKSGNVAQRTEMAFIGDDVSGHARMWVDGNLTMGKQLTTAGAENNVTTYAGFWDKLNNCLANAGIPSWVITAISIARAAVCVGTVGLGCVGCIAAAAGVWGGQVGYCIDQAQK